MVTHRIGILLLVLQRKSKKKEQRRYSMGKAATEIVEKKILDTLRLTSLLKFDIEALQVI